MSSIGAGHSAQNATVGMNGQLAALEAEAVVDEAGRRIKKVRAAVAHCEDQLSILEDQAERIADKAARLRQEWKAKTVQAEAMRDTARLELERWQAELNQFERRG